MADPIFKSTVKNGKVYNLSEQDLKDADWIPCGENRYHFIYDNITYLLEVEKSCFETKQFSIRVNGKRIELHLADKFDMMIQKMGLNNKEKKLTSELLAPMPGMVLDIMVSEGEEVVKGQSLLILEAMKMENVIKSPTDGKIKKVNVNLQSAVNKNEILIRFE